LRKKVQALLTQAGASPNMAINIASFCRVTKSSVIAGLE